MSDERYALKTTGNGGEASRMNLTLGATTFSFLQSGDLFEITHGEAMMNQIRGNLVDGSMNNIYLRIYDEAGSVKTVAPLLGVDSNSDVSFGKSQVKWEGEVDGLDYIVTFTLAGDGIWFWHVEVEAGAHQVDLLFTQDVGLAHRGMIQSNEAYTSQYVDYKVFDHEEKGYVVCARQNQPQNGKFPYLQQGALTKTKAYSTDGYQFFGLDYKGTDVPVAFFADKLESIVYQYEFGYVALQSEIKSGTVQEIFYGLAKDTHDLAITELEFLTEIETAWKQIADEEGFGEASKIKLADKIGHPLAGNPLSMAEITTLYPNRIQEEFGSSGELLSFFTPTYEHVVLKEKELQVERAHGHILLSGDHLTINEAIMTTTSYMYGIFNAQVAVGNTTMNKLMSNARNGLNVMKTSGQRIYVEIEGSYRLLTLPSAFEMGFNYARWHYLLKDDKLTITNDTTKDAPEINLHVKSDAGKAYRFIVTNQIIMNEKEYEVPFSMTGDEQTLMFKPMADSFISHYYPELTYYLHVEGTKMKVTDETTLLDGVHSLAIHPLVVLELETTSCFTITIQGAINGEKFKATQRDFCSETVAYKKHFAQVMNGFKLSQHGTVTNELEKMNITAWWYTHNMFIHYLVPHGLEQYGGAAWGTRDVCQGPFEYFLAMGKYDVCRSILLKVFSHQFEDDGNFPQWFMFDQYVNIHASDAHGDIIAWPLYVMATYLKVTEDFSILEEEIPYLDRRTASLTPYTETLFAHVKKEIDYIKANFLHDTHLSCYGDGDWDDTLQPHDVKLKTYMASSWTVALTYKGMKLLADALADVKVDEAQVFAELAAGIKADYRKYIMTSDVIPGFLYLEDPTRPEFMIHPSDDKLGIDYRLLPMQQSMIAELFTAEEASAHLKIIREHLQCPDGVRLMNKPATYAGGVSSKFKRAEQASNFGREVGLQYVHAHIRFIEAMAKLGEADEAWKGLFVINPINLKEAVPNAEMRQSNAYFSSSDGKFNDRYEAGANFDKLRRGDVAVKGGWRIYSSGPGIYLNQLISNVLGIRLEGNMLVIDPVLPNELDGLVFEFAIAGKMTTFKYHLGDTDKKVVVNGTLPVTVSIRNEYRAGGFKVDLTALDAKHNVVEVWI